MTTTIEQDLMVLADAVLDLASHHREFVCKAWWAEYVDRAKHYASPSAMKEFATWLQARKNEPWH